MKLILPLVGFLLLFVSCKREKLIPKPTPTRQDKLIFEKQLPLNNYSQYAKSNVVTTNSQFLVLNKDWRSSVPSTNYLPTHTWYDEYFNETHKYEEWNSIMMFETMAREVNNCVFYYFNNSYPLFWSSNYLNNTYIYRLKGYDFSRDTIFRNTDTVAAGQIKIIDFFKISQKGTMVFHFKDSVFCMDTFGSIKWKIPSSPLNLSTLRDVCETASGDILLLGEKQSVATDRDFCVTRLDKSGNVVWQKVYGGKFYDEAQEILYTDDQQIFLIGGSNSFINKTDPDAFIIHINSNGETLQQQSFGGTYRDVLQCGKFYKDQLVVTGYHDIDGTGKLQVFVALLDKKLNLLQQAEAPYTINQVPTSCALINTTFAVCGDKFLMQYALPY